MYLKLFKAEEKDLFFSLAYFIVQIDGEISVEESELISSYKEEINEDIKEKLIICNKDNLIEQFSILDRRTQKMMTFELIGLAMCDKNFDSDEKSFIKELLQGYESADYYIEQCERVIKDYLLIQDRINNLVLN